MSPWRHPRRVFWIRFALAVALSAIWVAFVIAMLDLAFGGGNRASLI